MRFSQMQSIDTIGTATVTIDGKTYQGGLYPNGSNDAPEAHKKALADTVAKIKPRKRNSIVFVGLGASNTAIEMQALMLAANGNERINDDVDLVNCCKGGISLSKINDVHGRYTYQYIPAALVKEGYDTADPQVGWLKTDELVLPVETDFEQYLTIVVSGYINALQNLKKALPNLKLLYLTSRHTTRYVTIPDLDKHKEPRAFFSQFVIKKLIEMQIAGEPSLAFSGPDKKVPLITWGPLFYSDGAIDNTFGHNWTEDDVKPTDHLHPSSTGAYKTANYLLNFLLTDEFASKWFAKQ